MGRTKFPKSIKKQYTPSANPATSSVSTVTDITRSSLRPIPKEENPFQEIGVAGVKISGGFVHDEFLPQLIGSKGRRIYREMRDNDATISAILFVVQMMIRAVDWRVEFDQDDTEFEIKGKESNANPKGFTDIKDGETAIEFLEGVLFDDMSHTWNEFISQVLSMLVFGWQYSEIVWKRRLGHLQRDLAKKSIYDDGLIGIRKLADRSQETLERWEIDEYGGVMGMWQRPPVVGNIRYIPIERALLFRPTSFKDSPEGYSALRGSYRSWFLLKNLQEIEAIAIERELNGLPVAYIPDRILNAPANDAPANAAKNDYIQLVRDIKFNEQGGVVLPSNTYTDSEGKLTDIKQVTLELLSTNGTRAIDVRKTIRGYQEDISRTFQAGFMLLGQGSSTGSYKLSENQTDFFVRSLEGWLEEIASVINKHLVPRLWMLNGFDLNYIPYIVPGRMSPENLTEIGNYVRNLSQSGISLFDTDTENDLRTKGGLPEKPLEPEEGNFNTDIKSPSSENKKVEETEVIEE